MIPILTHTTLLTALAILMRGVGVTLRVSDPPAVRLTGWLACGLATWAAAGAAGAFSPVWPVLVIGMVGGALEWLERSRGFFAAGDAAVVIAVLVTSTPRLGWQTTVLFLLALAAGWGLIEVVVRAAAGTWLRVAGGALGAAALTILLATALPSGPGLNLLPLGSMLPHLAASSECDGERVEFEGGVVGWLDRPVGGAGGLGALHLHGNDRRASRQPAACALRRSLVHAGFLTLAVDHPGYGQSPNPPLEAPVEEWDYTPAHAEAYAWLAAQPGVEHVVVVGHSMGVRDAMRLAASRPDVPLFFLFAGSIGQPGERAGYWYRRFHQERGLSDTIPRWKWEELERTLYDGERAVRELSPEHGHMVFWTAGREWENVAAGRGPLFDLIPGPKELWHLPGASHYFNAFSVAGITVGDARVVRRVAAGMRARAAELVGEREALTES